MLNWCDDERNVNVFLKPCDPVENDATNIWKDVYDYLDFCSRRKYDEIKYIEYIYEPLCQPSDDDDSGWEWDGLDSNNAPTSTEFNEGAEIHFKKNIYAYS
jgi:hypothetical protein